MPTTATVTTHHSVLVVTTVSAYDGLTESASFLWWREHELDEGWRHYSRLTSSATAVLEEIGGDALRVSILRVPVPGELDGDEVTTYLDDVLGVDTYNCPLPAVATFDWSPQPYRTITVVVRSTDRDDVMHALSRNEYVLFAASDAGISAEAMRLGASPEDWQQDDCDDDCLRHRSDCDGLCTHIGHVNVCTLYPPSTPGLAANPATGPALNPAPGVTADTETGKV